VDVLGWTVVGSVAGVVGAAAAIVFGLIPLLRKHNQVPKVVDETENESSPASVGEDHPVVVGEILQEPVGFQPRADLLAALDAPAPGSRVVVVHAVTGMRGVGKTHLAAEFARAKLEARWRLVAWINAEDLGGVLAGLTDVATALNLNGKDAEAAGLAVRNRLEIDGDQCLWVRLF
jgi:hypothetical protein